VLYRLSYQPCCPLKLNLSIFGRMARYFILIKYTKKLARSQPSKNASKRPTTSLFQAKTLVVCCFALKRPNSFKK